jgi:hypothetical protein
MNNISQISDYFWLVRRNTILDLRTSIVCVLSCPHSFFRPCLHFTVIKSGLGKLHKKYFMQDASNWSRKCRRVIFKCEKTGVKSLLSVGSKINSSCRLDCKDYLCLFALPIKKISQGCSFWKKLFTKCSHRYMMTIRRKAQYMTFVK